MQIYEKAIENYAKARNEFHRREQKLEVARFSRLVEKMTADGECLRFDCKYCPVRLAAETGIEIAGCGVSTPQERREVIAREIKE